MAVAVPHTIPEVSALVQHYLLYRGATYTSRASEENWKHVPVTLAVPAASPVPAETPLPGGTWLVLPWEAPTGEQLAAYLQRLQQGGAMPDVVVVVMVAPMLREPVLRQLGVLYGIQVVGISAVDGLAFGSQAAHAVQQAFDPHQLAALETVNPLEHLAALGDPRNPDVFFERLRRASRGSPVTLLLVAVNVLVYVAMALFAEDRWAAVRIDAQAGFQLGQLRQAGANIAALTVTQHEVWRLLTCTFVHANIVHIAMNMLVLKSIGDTAERLFGPSMFSALYLLSALGGSIASLAWTLAAVPDMPSVGASGAVFGVMGGLLGFALSRRDSVPALVYRQLMRSALMFTVINIALGMWVAQIDNAAHLGGLGVGFVAGLILSRDLPPAPQPTAMQRVVVLSVCFGVLGVAFQLAAQLVQ